jgi:hypothetical protein
MVGNESDLQANAERTNEKDKSRKQEIKRK